MKGLKTILLSGKFYKEYLEVYKNKIHSILNKPSDYRVAVFYFKTRNNNYFSINQSKIFSSLGLQVELVNPQNQEEFIELIGYFSKDPKTVGINVELPLPQGFSNECLGEINIYKDLDCLNPYNYYRFLTAMKEELSELVIPSVANAVYLMLDHYEIDFERKDIVVLGKSLYTGLAIANFMLKYNCTVQILNEHSVNPEEKCNKADIIISATGKVGLINEKFVNQNSVVIDVGFEVVNGVIKGDVDIERVKGIAKAVSIVPGGIGLLCNLSTVQNLYKLLRR
ncbi:MAG: bifunctional 5,10-methylenetetrahydrofolate dehydrogenase/5,10-methenyltetrahydrofolate cyclohydrolase [bacterium]